MAGQQEQFNLLVFALEKTLSPKSEERTQAENTLKQFESAAGYVVVLFSITVNTEAPVHIRQAASIYLKNLFRKVERLSNQRVVEPRSNDLEIVQQITISDTDKGALKQNIMKALVEVPLLIQKQLCETLKCLVESDFPEKWPDLISSLQQLLVSQNRKETAAGLLALYCVVKNYQLRDEDSREPLNQVVENVFPLLLQLITALNTAVDPDSGHMIKIVCKAFTTTIQFGIPRYFLNPDTFLAWMTQLNIVLMRNVTEGEPADPELKKDWPWWKARKWACHTFNRLFSRFATPEAFEDDEVDLKKFSVNFQKIYALKLMEGYLTLVGNFTKGAYLPEKIIQLAFEYLNTAIKFGVTFSALKPNLQPFIQQVVFPAVCSTDYDLQVFAQDPTEYLRKEFDILEEFYNCKKAAFNIIYDLFKYRSKDNFFQFMAFVIMKLNAYLQAPPDQKPYKEKDGLMFLIGSLAARLKNVVEFQNSLEDMLVNHVLPEFSSSIGLLRAKACWVFGEFAEIEFKKNENLLAGLSQVLRCMKDPELPVRIQAGIAIGKFLEVTFAVDQLRPMLPQLLEEMLNLMKQFESDELIGSLKTMINTYGNEIHPFALALTERLISSFSGLIEDRQEDTSVLAASECLTTIQTLLLSVCKHKEIFIQMERVIFPLVVKLLHQDLFEFCEDTCNMLSILTYYTPVITPTLWTIFPVIMNGLHNWCPDFIEDFLPCIDNMISRSPEIFLSDPQYMNMVFSLYSKMIDPPKTKVAYLSEEDSGVACEIMEVVLQNCKGKVDNFIQPVLTMTVQRLFTPAHTKRNAFKILLLDVVANCFYYNTPLSVSVLDGMKNENNTSILGNLFLGWFKTLRTMKRKHDRKVSVLGLSTLFLHFNSLPAIIQMGAKDIVVSLASISLDLHKEKVADLEKKAKRNQKEKSGESSGTVVPGAAGADVDIEGEDEEYEDLDEEEPDEETPDAEDVKDELESLKMLTHSVSKLLKEEKGKAEGFGEEVVPHGGEGIDEGDDDEDEEEDEDDDDDDGFPDEEDILSPIDKVDETIYFVQSMKVFSENARPTYEKVIQSVTAESQAQFQELIKIAEAKSLRSSN